MELCYIKNVKSYHCQYIRVLFVHIASFVHKLQKMFLIFHKTRTLKSLFHPIPWMMIGAFILLKELLAFDFGERRHSRRRNHTYIYTDPHILIARRRITMESASIPYHEVTSLQD